MRKPPERTECAGWTEGATRRNTAFLMSVDALRLSGMGFAVTLTFKECPPTEAEYKRIREAFFKRLRRNHLLRLHWVTEWTKRGIPHLHCAIYFDISAPGFQFVGENGPHASMLRHWLELTAHLGTQSFGQHIRHIEDGGWFQYMAKHAARGVKHYQRDSNLPPGWVKTGRVWGHLGDWPTVDEKHRTDDRAFFALRRLAKRWLTAKARHELHRHDEYWSPFHTAQQERDWKRDRRARINTLTFSRTVLKTPGRTRSACKGIAQWIPLNASRRMVQFVTESQGHRVVLDSDLLKLRDDWVSANG